MLDPFYLSTNYVKYLFFLLDDEYLFSTPQKSLPRYTDSSLVPS